MLHRYCPTGARVWFCAVFLLFVVSAQVEAAGFALYTQSASALGQGNAVTAHQDEASAVFYNPALISNFDGTRLEIGTTMIHSSRSYRSSTGGNDKSVSANHYLGSLFATHRLAETLTLGLGIYSPFGLGTDWGDTWEGRYISTNSELQTISINPVISWRIHPNMAVAAGFSYLRMDATLEKNLYLAPLPDGAQKFSGDGDGFGYNLGVTVKLAEGLTLGANYRSAIDLDLDGRATFRLPAGTPAPIAMMLSNSNGSTSVTLPQQAQLGLAWQATETLLLEVGTRWEDWSSFKSLEIELDSGLTTTTERNWKDVYAFNLGARYQLSPAVDLLAGYLLDGNPAPDSTFDPSIPTAKAHIFSLGSRYRYQAWTIAAAYAWQHYQSRSKNNQVGLTSGGTANGSYETDNHMFALSLGYRF